MQADALAALRDRIAALRAPPCGMAHESILAAPDGAPVQNSTNNSGYARAGVCPDAVRRAHLGCSHTMARYVLRDALNLLPGSDKLAAELHELEQAISLLDHRRYDVEVRRADSIMAWRNGDVIVADREIAALVAEHHGYVTRAARLRDEVLRRLDDTLAAPCRESERETSRGST
jgi:hypothetical protein